MDEITERALETLRRTEEADLLEEPRTAVYAEEKWNPDNPRKLTVASMSRAEFNAWCEAGRPALEATLPAVPEKRTSEAPRGRYATQKWVGTVVRMIAKETALAMAEHTKAKLAPLRSDLDDVRRNHAALAVQADQMQNELRELKRAADIERKVNEARNNRRAEMLELENSLLKAGRRPEAEDTDELPAFGEWPRHAQ